MRNIILIALMCLGCISTHAQGEFTIQGKVKGLKDGTVVVFFRKEGDVGRGMGRDTVKNESFSFKGKTLEGTMERWSVLCMGTGFPSMGLDLWIAPKVRIKITGDNNYLYTWKVKSPIEQQKIRTAFVEDSRELWEEYQRLRVEEGEIARALRAGDKGEEEKKAAKAACLELSQKGDSIRQEINVREIAMMKKTPVTEVWMDKLKGLSWEYNQKDFPYKEDVLALYNRLTEEQKASDMGKQIKTRMFPPVVINEGDKMVDADLFDLKGNVHHLADYKGKHILLDFWSSGCGPCIMSLPEMKEIAEQYKDRLAVVSLNTDKKKTWERASKEHEMTWSNLNDLQGTTGLNAKYGVQGIPSYVLISPEGVVLKKWSGYGKGSLKLKMRRWLDVANAPMSVVGSDTRRIVNNPTMRSANTDIHTIRQVEWSDTATIVRVRGYYIPRFWIQVSSSIALIADNGTVCPLKYAKDIPLDKHYFMPESGEADYTFVFEPLPRGTKVFDMVERNVEHPDKLEGIALSMPDTYTVAGRLEGVEDGTPIGLWKSEGNTYRKLADMPLKDGAFRFEGSCGEGRCSEILISGDTPDFPNTHLSVWVEPGAQVSVTGNGKIYADWKVESNVEEQQAMNRFAEATRKWRKPQQEAMAKSSWLNSQVTAAQLSAKEKRAMLKKVKKLYKQSDEWALKMAPAIIRIMQETEVSPVWIKHLNELGYLYKYNPRFEQKEETVALYNRLGDKEKAMLKGLLGGE